ncbi:MAG: hypothetical protein E7282_05680 [Lachnospiraceae bacterium]|nr:hypothetical protein [Lachnospiraceae bacterium]
MKRRVILEEKEKRSPLEKRKAKKKLRNERPQRIFRAAEIPLTILWLQLVFQLSTVGHISGKFVLFGLLFGISYGLLLEFLVSLIPNATAYRIVKAVVIGVLGILITAVYFVFCKFNTFYDLKTMFGGAGGAVGEFQDSIMKLIFCANGIIHIILYLIPLILNIVAAVFLTKKFANVIWRERINSIATAIVVYILALILVRVMPSAWNTYKVEYNYTHAIEKFGIFTGLRLDVKHSIMGGNKDLSFDITPTTPVVENDDTQSTEDGTEVVEYGDNVLDIDFAKLAESTNDEALAQLDNYVASLQPSNKNAYTGLFEGKNLIFISAEAFSAQAIDEELTPTLYRMATKGFQFTDYYQPESAGTTGGEYNNIFGMLPTSGGTSFKEAADNLNYMTMGWQLNLLGYWGKAYHNNTYTFYDRNITHNSLGYSEGYMGWGNGMEKYYDRKTWPESDLVMIQGTVEEYIDQDHFNVYYMSVSGHSDYTFSDNYMAYIHEDDVADLDCSEPIKAYKACNIELNDAMEYLIKRLEEEGKADDTVIVIGADHFPYGLDDGGDSVNMPYLSELYGESIDNDLVRDQNRLIIWSGCLEKEDPVEISTPMSSIDILPTLMNLFGIEYDSRLLVGRDVFSDTPALVFNVSYDWKTEYGTYIASTGTFTPASDDVVYPNGYTEEEYIDYIKTIVRNKMKYCAGVLDNDYYAHVFGDGTE